MLTFRPYGACRLFDACNYKHFVPTGLAVSERVTFQHRAIQFSGFDTDQCQRGLRLGGKLSASGGDVALTRFTQQANHGIP